nr:MAG TPA: hypothetical protein [Bacteriophage sp.]
MISSFYIRIKYFSKLFFCSYSANISIFKSFCYYFFSVFFI